MPNHKNYLIKLIAILPLFSVIAWGSLLLLGFVRWFFFLGRFPILEFDEEIWNFWIPAAFPWIPILLWLKFDMFAFRKDAKGAKWRMQLIAWLTMWSMLIFSQHYLTTSVGKLLELPNVKEISKHNPVRYYRLDSFAVYRPIGGVRYAFRKTGRYNQNLEIDIYFAHPILTHKNQHIIMTPLYWYGVKFHKQISNLGNQLQKEKLFRTFFQDCVEKMKNYDFYKLDHFERKPASYDRDNFRIAVQNAVRKPVNNDFVILQPVQDAVEQRNGHKIAWMIFCYTLGIGIFMLALIRPQLKSDLETDEAEDVQVF